MRYARAILTSRRTVVTLVEDLSIIRTRCRIFDERANSKHGPELQTPSTNCHNYFVHELPSVLTSLDCIGQMLMGARNPYHGFFLAFRIACLRDDSFHGIRVNPAFRDACTCVSEVHHRFRDVLLTGTYTNVPYSRQFCPDGTESGAAMVRAPRAWRSRAGVFGS